MLFPTVAEMVEKMFPANCIPSPESPAKSTTTSLMCSIFKPSLSLIKVGCVNVLFKVLAGRLPEKCFVQGGSVMYVIRSSKPQYACKGTYLL